jgi:hypothetical protein
MSPVMTSRFLKSPLRACESMYSFCVRELEKAVIWLFGKTSARYKLREPQPHLFGGDDVSCQVEMRAADVSLSLEIHRE